MNNLSMLYEIYSDYQLRTLQLIKYEFFVRHADVVENKVTSRIKLKLNINRPEESFVYSQLIILLYTYLDAFICDIVKMHIENHKERLGELYKLADIKIKSLAEYEKLNWKERIEFIFKAYEKDISVGYGYRRFMNLLETFRIDENKFDSSLFKAITELAQTRNVLLHNRGKIDSKFLTMCPWRHDLILDTEIEVTGQTFDNYFNCCEKFTTQVYVMVNEIINSSPTPQQPTSSNPPQ